MSLAAVNCTTSASQLVAANSLRKLLIIQNLSDTDVYLKMDDSATEVTVANGLRLAAGDPPLVITCRKSEHTFPVRGIHGGSGNKDLRIQEVSYVS